MFTIKVDLGSFVASIQDRVKHAFLVGEKASTTDLYQTDPAFRDSVDGYRLAGEELQAADAKVLKLAADLDEARGQRKAKVQACNKAKRLCASHLEKKSTSVQQVQASGFDVLDSTTSVGIPAPVAIEVTYDRATRTVRIHVRYGSDNTYPCTVEVGSEAGNEASFKRIDGHGVLRTLAGLANGTWLIRAATERARARGDWFGPVPVIVD